MLGFGEKAERLFDLSELPETERDELSADIVILMWEVLSRIELPPLHEVPDLQDMKRLIQQGEPDRYVIPNTEITITKIEDGDRAGEYLFSASTTLNTASYFEKVENLPYVRPIALEHPWAFDMVWGGPQLMPPKRAEALPKWLKQEREGQARWKWLAQIVVFSLVLGIVWLVHFIAGKVTRKHSLPSYILSLLAPITFLALTPLMQYMWHVQVGIAGMGGAVVQIIQPALTYLASAWLMWCIPQLIGEIIISNPRISNSGLDAHLLRLLMRMFGITGVIVIIFVGGNNLGLPFYGLLAGASVGGLAIALAAQNTLENILGSLNLFADRPVRVGDFCRYGDSTGTIEEIGLRSTQIRGLDRTVTTIPNSDFSKMAITNLTRRERMLLNAKIGLRYEATSEQLRYVLAKLREMLLAHPMVLPKPARVRFIGFGDSSLDLEVFAYLSETDWDNFLKIQDDVNFRIMEIVAESGTGFAFPSQTIYMAKDSASDNDLTEAACHHVEDWRNEGNLPFPDFDENFRKTHEDTLDYPPKGSAVKHETENQIPPTKPLKRHHFRKEKQDNPPKNMDLEGGEDT